MQARRFSSPVPGGPCTYAARCGRRQSRGVPRTTWRLLAFRVLGWSEKPATKAALPRTPSSSPRDHLWERTAKRVGRRRVTATDGAHRTMVNSFVSDTGVEVPAVRALRFRARMSAKGLRLDTWDGS